MKIKNYTLEEVKNAIANTKSKAGALKYLNIIPAGGNYKTLDKLILKHNIDISHFTGQGWNVGLQFIPNPKQPLSEILIENSKYSSTYKLKNRLLKEGVKEYICESCSSTKWLEVKIPLELHHINGVSNDNRIENLQLLCPNCHALTNNYRGKNKC